MPEFDGHLLCEVEGWELFEHRKKFRIDERIWVERIWIEGISIPDCRRSF